MFYLWNGYLMESEQRLSPQLSGSLSKLLILKNNMNLPACLRGIEWDR